MKIGIDARAASHPRRGGMKTYAENLLQALANLENTNEYMLYFDRPYWLSNNKSENYSNTVIPGSPKLIGAGWREQWRLPRQIAKDNLILLHSLCNTAPLRMTIPSVVTLHDVIALTEPQAHYNLSAGSIALKLIELYGKLTIPASARQASAIITVSSYEKEQIIKLFNLPSDKVFVTHLAPSLYFKPILPDQRSAGFIVLEQKYGIKIPYLIGVGFEPRKNIDIVIQAYVRLLNNESSKILNLVLVCAHQGIAEKLRNQIDNLGLKGKVLVLADIRHDDLRLLYGLSTALVFPSRRESFGLPPLEAMASGTPVIASNSSSLPEVLGKAALLVDPNDVSGIVEAAFAILTNTELRSSYIEKGIEHSKKFSWEKTATETLAVYKSIMNRPQ
jgi:glycosyltransferase involved in cell wall biosynthesis